MKILFAAPENAWGGFLGMIRKELPEHDFEATGEFRIETLSGYEILIPTMCPVTAEMLAGADRLKLIQQCGSGLEGVDISSAKDKNIWVANVPTDISGNADSVAELGIYLMIGLSRNFKGMAESLANRKTGEPQGKTLAGKTVGFVGLGGIARALIRKLSPFDARFIGVKRSTPHKAQKVLGLEWAGGPDDLGTLLEYSDFVVLCLPLTEKSRGIIGEDAFRGMKPSAFLINLSRGGLVNRQALENALAEGRIAGAGLDVFWDEPVDPDDPVFRYNVMATPHIGGSTDTSMQGIVKSVAENIRRIERNETPLNHQNS